MSTVLILTGTCGIGKTTVSKLIAANSRWQRISEDDIWKEMFGRNRGAFGSEEHRLKRRRVHEVVFAGVLAAKEENQNVVIDATVHEAPPEAYGEYKDFFEVHGIPWHLRVLHPRLEVAVQRDSLRPDWVAGRERVVHLYAKFTRTVFAPQCFLDTSDDTPDQTVARILNSIAKSNPSMR